MFLGISSNSRRDMLKMALNMFIENIKTVTDEGGPIAFQLANEMAAEAQHVLRVIAASENLAMNQHPTYSGVPTTHDNGES